MAFPAPKSKAYLPPLPADTYIGSAFILVWYLHSYPETQLLEELKCFLENAEGKKP